MASSAIFDFSFFAPINLDYAPKMVTHSTSNFNLAVVAALSLSFACGVATSGCSDGSAKKSTTVKLVYQPNRHHEGPPLSDQECAAFAEKMVTAVREADIDAAQALFDLDATVETASTGIELPAKKKGEFLRGVKHGFSGGGGLFAEIRQAITKGGTFHLLRTRTVEGERRAVFRLVLLDDGGINYLEFPLARRPSGQVLATDVYIYLSGEFMSQTLRRALLPVAVHENRGIIERLQGAESEFVQNVEKFQRMTQQNRSQQFREALDTYRSLPPSLRKEKLAMLVRLQSAQKVSDEEYAAAIEDIRREFPRDPCVDFVSIDAFILKRQFDEALVCVDRLDKALDTDPYLNVLRANIHLERLDLPSARATAEKAVHASEAHRDAYLTFIRVTLAEGRYDVVRQGLEILLNKFDLDLGELAENEEFAEFVKSPEHARWLKHRAERTKRTSQQ